MEAQDVPNIVLITSCFTTDGEVQSILFNMLYDNIILLYYNVDEESRKNIFRCYRILYYNTYVVRYLLSFLIKKTNFI